MFFRYLIFTCIFIVPIIVLVVLPVIGCIIYCCQANFSQQSNQQRIESLEPYPVNTEPKPYYLQRLPSEAPPPYSSLFQTTTSDTTLNSRSNGVSVIEI